MYVSSIVLSGLQIKLPLRSVSYTSEDFGYSVELLFLNSLVRLGLGFTVFVNLCIRLKKEVKACPCFHQ